MPVGSMVRQDAALGTFDRSATTWSRAMIRTVWPMLIVVGVTADDQPRGARFHIEDEALVRRAATALGYRAIVATSAADRKLALKLKPGHLYRPARQFAPAISPKTYAALIDLPPGPSPTDQALLT